MCAIPSEVKSLSFRPAQRVIPACGRRAGFGREREPFWNYIWEQAQQSLRSADEIVIIGYSMPKADERAKELLLKNSNRDAEILVFSDSRSGAICEEFRNCGFQTVNSVGDGYFEDYLNA